MSTTATQIERQGSMLLDEGDLGSELVSIIERRLKREYETGIYIYLDRSGQYCGYEFGLMKDIPPYWEWRVYSLLCEDTFYNESEELYELEIGEVHKRGKGD